MENDSKRKRNFLQHKRITRKPTLTDQRAQEGKYALQQYLRTSSEEGHSSTSIHTDEITVKNSNERDKKERI